MDTLTVRDLLYMGIILTGAVSGYVALRVTVGHMDKTQIENKKAHEKALDEHKDDFEKELREQKEVEKQHFDQLLSKINGIGKKFDNFVQRDNTRYRKISMAMVGLSMAMPESNPHRRDIKALVDSLASENGGT